MRLIHGRLWYLDSKLKKGQHSRACSQVRLFCCAFGRFKDVTVSLLLPPFFDWTIRHKWPAAISSFSGFVVRHWYFGPAVCLFDAKIDANLPKSTQIYQIDTICHQTLCHFFCRKSFSSSDSCEECFTKEVQVVGKGVMFPPFRHCIK